MNEVRSDGANWRLGHWLTGRLGSVSLAAVVRHLCVRAGMLAIRIDVSGLWGLLEGFGITALESPRASIAMLARHFGFDAIESQGAIRFVMRGRGALMTVTPDDLVAPSGTGDAFELTRGQETELHQALKWQVVRSDEDDNAAVVEARGDRAETAAVAARARHDASRSPRPVLHRTRSPSRCRRRRRSGDASAR